MASNKTRRVRSKSEGGSCGGKVYGGKRHRKSRTRKMAKGASDWNKKVMEVYRDMKKKDASVKLGAAMKKASEMKKKGLL
jgi:hypothetical protein